MVEVTFIKDHNEFKQGDSASVDDGLANYWALTGVAERKGKKEHKEQEKDYETKEDKVVNTRKKK